MGVPSVTMGEIFFGPDVQRTNGMYRQENKPLNNLMVKRRKFSDALIGVVSSGSGTA